MSSPDQCPRCRATRLAVVYYDANGQPLGGHSQCTECGPRHAVRLVPRSGEVRKQLLSRKAS
ncbi:MAG TPA: hypothetical protein VGQ42_08080 [Candidatus Dormibacteraeota bacterium]|jgi:hypothetical protein|nr:hypothetical protein [Candidatus Dormibacteraeota bacterium]